jgi:hypothetical protein
MRKAAVQVVPVLAWLLLATAACSDSGGGPQDVAGDETGGEGDAADLAPDAADDGTTGEDGGAGDPLSEEFLTAIVTELASDEMNGREPGTPGWAAARALVEEQMTACGLEPAGVTGYEQPVEGGLGLNVLGRITGTDPARRDRLIILGAHYDHLGSCDGDICNGAYDNATAVAAALGVGCALVAAPPSRSVLLAIWDTEEPPTFLTDEMGSQYYAGHPLVPLAQTDVAIALDLIGAGMWDGYMGHFVMGGELSPEVAALVDAASVPAGLEVFRFGLHLAEETVMGHQAWSDYDAFRNLGVPVLFFSDGQNKRYHQPSDEVAGVDFPKLVLETRYLHAIVGNLAEAVAAPSFVADGTDYPRDVAALLAVSEDVLATGGMADVLALSATSRTKLEQDRTALQAAQATLDGGGTLSATEVQTLRSATQRVMCLAGSSYTEALCALF